LSTGLNGSLGFFYGTGTAVITGSLSVLPLWDGRWHHIALVKTTSELRFYIDAMLWGTQTGASVAIAPSTGIPLIVGDYNGGGLNFPGSLDELRFWSTARSGAELFALRDHRAVGNESGLLACWHFDEGSGLTVVDASSNAYSLTLTGGITWSASDKPTLLEPGEAVARPTVYGFWYDNPPPAETVEDLNPVNLGLKFIPQASGSVVGLRFFKNVSNTGTHHGYLWTAGGTLLTSVTFTGETNYGWQQMLFSSPVTVTAGTTYIVSYHSPNGPFPRTENYFGSALTVGSLLAPSSASSGGNGIFAYGVAGLLPNNTFNDTNYWVEPLFQPLTFTASGTATQAAQSEAGVASLRFPASGGTRQLVQHEAGTGTWSYATRTGVLSEHQLAQRQNGLADLRFTATLTSAQSAQREHGSERAAARPGGRLTWQPAAEGTVGWRPSPAGTIAWRE
jgi:hypothetical protein